MPPVASGRVRRRARGSKRPYARARSAEDWWWDRLAPRGSGYHLLQADSMLLVLPDVEPTRARAHRRAPRRARGPKAAAKPRAKPRPEPSPDQGPDSGWGDRIPLEVLVHIFGLLVAAHGPVPFLGRAAHVCRRWHEVTSDLSLWRIVTLSLRLVGRAAKGNLKAEGAPCFLGVAHTQSGLTAPEGDPHALEVSSRLCVGAG